MSARGQFLRVYRAVVDAQVIEVLEILHVGAAQGFRTFGPAARVAFFIIVLKVRHVSGESPAGAAVHVGRCESVKAKLRSAAVDIFRNSFQTFEVLDLIHGVTGRFDEVRIDNDAVAFIAVADGDELSVFRIQVVGVRIQLIGDRRIFNLSISGLRVWE